MSRMFEIRMFPEAGAAFARTAFDGQIGRTVPVGGMPATLVKATVAQGGRSRRPRT